MRKPLVAHLLTAVRQALGQVVSGEKPPQPGGGTSAAPSEFNAELHDATNSFWFSAHLDERPRFETVDTRRASPQRPGVTSTVAD